MKRWWVEQKGQPTPEEQRRERFARARAALLDVLAYHGMTDTVREDSTAWQSVHCPFHDDQKRSASVNLYLERFHCFACDVSGDSLALVATMENISREEALEWIESTLGLSGPRKDGSPGTG